MIKIQNFLGLVGYYKRFIEGFSKITLPLTKLTQKGIKFEQFDNYECSFQQLKSKFVANLVLTIPLGLGGFVMYSDASHQGQGLSSYAAWESCDLCFQKVKIL